MGVSLRLYLLFPLIHIIYLEKHNMIGLGLTQCPLHFVLKKKV